MFARTLKGAGQILKVGTDAADDLGLTYKIHSSLLLLKGRMYSRRTPK